MTGTVDLLDHNPAPATCLSQEVPKIVELSPAAFGARCLEYKDGKSVS
jgi:hypothetical protein